MSNISSHLYNNIPSCCCRCCYLNVTVEGGITTLEWSAPSPPALVTDRAGFRSNWPKWTPFLRGPRTGPANQGTCLSQITSRHCHTKPATEMLPGPSEHMPSLQNKCLLPGHRARDSLKAIWSIWSNWAASRAPTVTASSLLYSWVAWNVPCIMRRAQRVKCCSWMALSPATASNWLEVGPSLEATGGDITTLLPPISGCHFLHEAPLAIVFNVFSSIHCIHCIQFPRKRDHCVRCFYKDVVTTGNNWRVEFHQESTCRQEGRYWAQSYTIQHQL